MRENSMLGESELDRRSRRWIGLICGTLMGLLVIWAVVWAWVGV